MVAASARSSSRCRPASGTCWVRRCSPTSSSLAGYEVLNLGADTPPASLARVAAAHDDLRAVIVTVVDSSHLAAAARLIAAARRIDGGPPVIAGGFAVTDVATARSIGADEWGADPRDLGALIASLADRQPRTG